jgi:putative intracellular protease/amidase
MWTLRLLLISLNIKLRKMESKKTRILMVVSSPTISTTTGWPVGFWAAELTHAYKLFLEKGYDVTIASPKGGKVEVDILGILAAIQEKISSVYNFSKIKNSMPFSRTQRKLVIWQKMILMQ